MTKKLIIVESPGKIKTLAKFLGSDYQIEASKGHVIDLPPSRFGVNTTNGFVPDFRVVKDRKDVILRLQQMAQKADTIYLAPDPDREGEAISWHLANLLNIDPLAKCRISFNSITKEDVLKSLESARQIDFALVNAQQSRRILDRLVGYRLSPFLWQKICLGLSAGRVQSVAVSLICIKEKEILAFIPEEYWTVTATLQTSAKLKFQAKLVKIDNKKPNLPNEASANSALDKIKRTNLIINDLVTKEKTQSPPPPFITSTLQAEAAQKHSFTPRRTMTIAQKLYEGIEIGKEGQVGLITYMRTDSVRISAEGLAELKDYIRQFYPPQYSLDKPRYYKLKKGAQDAHEAIRPTSVHRTPASLASFLKPEQLKLYTMIFNRFVASQMPDAKFKVVTANINCENVLLQATGSTMVFDGYTVLYPSTALSSDKQNLPDLNKNEPLSLAELDAKQNFTAPPARFTESSLIKTLEKEGIGRPSTYAAIVDTIQQRKYIKKSDGKLYPSDVAFVVNDILEKHFSEIIDTGFTSTMENALDKIEEGELDWQLVLEEFYEPFMTALKDAEEIVEKVQIETDLNCELCGKVMLLRLGKAGKFLACSGYPECKNTVNIPEEISIFANSIPQAPFKIAEILEEYKLNSPPTIQYVDETCEKCGEKMQLKTGRFGQFIACSAYPTCKNTRQILKEIGVNCPKPDCNGKILEKKSKRGRTFYGCSNYPDCDFVSWAKPTGTLCPDCNTPLVSHYTKKLGNHEKCPKKGCGYKHILEGNNNEEK